MSITLIILFVIIALVGIAIIAVIYTLDRHRKEGIQAQRIARSFLDRQTAAVWASATIINIRCGVAGGGEAGVSNLSRCELSLQVTPSGGNPYPARTTWLVESSRVSLLQPGQQLSVRIDPQDPGTIYPNESWAKYLPL